MLPSRLFARAALAALVLIAATTACSRSLAPFAANQRPTVELSRAPARTEGSQSVAYRIEWSGSDPDGSVSHFEYALDPPTSAEAAAGQETTWVRTDLREHTLTLRRSGDANEKRLLRERRTFVVRAVDTSADPATRTSAPRAWVFDELGVAPEVRIVSPQPSALLAPVLATPVEVTWQGTDPDGQSSTQPASYRTRLFGPEDGQALQAWIADPDSLRRTYEPLGYAGWDSLGGDAAFVALDGLQASERYLFVVVAIDETGTPTSTFSLDTNMLQFFAADPAATVPELFVGWAFDGFDQTPRSLVIPGNSTLQIPSGREIDLKWYAEPKAGARIKGYQWVLDPIDIGDFTARVDEQADVHRWSRSRFDAKAARIGPFAAGEVHDFWINVTDHGGRTSLNVVRISAIDVPLNRDLLIVDDTRLLGDSFLPGGQCLRPYVSSNLWPAAAELDTFLYAAGGVPWRGVTANCPTPTGAPVSSTPGIFAGYAFDTLGTRQGLENPSHAVPLFVLGQYRHVIWMVDLDGALATDPLHAARPVTALRYMSQAGRANVLSAYLGLGGKVWMVGAGGPMADLFDRNRTSNDQGLFGVVFSSTLGPTGTTELDPTRLTYERFHWKSELVVGRATNAIVRSTSLDRAPGPGQPDYSTLPTQLRRRTPATDPLPPTRAASSSSSFYVNRIDLAYLSQANSVLEDVDPDPSVVNEQSVLDTLYALDAPAGNLHPSGDTFPRPVMTYYRGSTGPAAILTGFGLWDVARPDAQALADFVLQDLWGLSRQSKLPRRAVALAERRPR